MSILLYIDDRLIEYDGEQVQFDEVAVHNVTCIASGGNPRPIVDLTFGQDDLNPETVSTCRVENNMEASFLAHVTCTSTATVFDMPIDYTVSGRALTCSARSVGSESLPLTMSSTVSLAGGQHLSVNYVNSSFICVYKYLLGDLCQFSSHFTKFYYSSFANGQLKMHN
jgi:hypothetical protein